MQGDETRRGPPGAPSDRTLWRRGCSTEVAEDDAARFLDLAGFADGRLDPDDHERVAARLAEDPVATVDVAAARALTAAEPGEPISQAMVARACALVGSGISGSAGIVRFVPRRRRGAGMQELARWGSLAAAIAVASWLGFTLGADASRSFVPGGHVVEDNVLNELLDPSTSLMRDLTEGSQT